ncbi:MAG: saccharopine dehydrogenase NADP-binding domain-containing protein [Eubacteriales bacterium]|nr:saccharopine dehydrogenase NADP-binding domain-containing protein [Eubacteriales bacterium]
MKKVMVCGCGAQGSTICRKLDQEPNIEEVVCADYDLKAAEAVCKLMKKGTPKQVDASSVENIKKAAEGCEMVIGVMPLHLLTNVLMAAKEMGICYQDLSACEGLVDDGDEYNSWISGVNYMYNNIGKEFAAKGATAIIGTGSAPGVMCVMARRAVQELDSCDTINMMVYEGVEAKRFLPYWWSPDVALADMSEDAMAFEDGKHVRTPAFSSPIYRAWPETDNQPVRMVEHSHDEPAYVGFHSDKYFKGAKNAYFKYGGVGIEFAEPLSRAGLLSYEEEEINGRKVIPHEVIRAHVPAAPKDPDEIKAIIDEGLVSDGGAFVVEAYGKKDGKDVMVDLHVTAPGLVESYKLAKMSAEMYLTGQGAFLFTKLFVNDKMTQKGLISSDELNDEQVNQYLEWARELGITYDINIVEGKTWTEKLETISAESVIHEYK